MESGVSQAFVAFIVLLVISVVVSGVLHYGLKYYVTAGTASFCSKVVLGYIGAWLAGPVLGSWFPGIALGGVDIIAAIVGSLAMLVFAVDVAKIFARAPQP